MLHKDSVSVKEFVDIHNLKIKRKISKRDLSKNLQQIIEMGDVTLNLKEYPDIEVTLPCVVGGIDFGNLIFRYELMSNIRSVKEYVKEYYDDSVLDNFSLTCNSERWGDIDYVAPHVDCGQPCFGGFYNNLFSHFIIHDYASMANTLRDFIKSMDTNSHYYFEALNTNILMCKRCESLVMPIVYKHSLPEEERYNNYYCKHCADLQKDY